MVRIVGWIALAVGILMVAGGFGDRVGRDASNKDLGTWMIFDGVALASGAVGSLLLGAWWPLIAAVVASVIVAFVILTAAEGLDL